METQDGWDDCKAMQVRWYVLNPDHTVRPAIMADDGMPLKSELALMYGHERHLDFTEIHARRFVSTVFLGLDHGFGGPPIVFETMVFTDGKGGDMERYSTYDEAMAGHKVMVEKVRKRYNSGLTKKQLEKAKAVIEPLLKR